jgi:hypothetical protein
MTDASFGLDLQARIDLAYAAYEKVTAAAKDLITQAYGRGPDRSYFVSCSGAGCQAMLFPQRFPAYLDGVSANARAIKVVKEASVASTWNVLTYTAIALADAGDRPVLSQVFSDRDLALVSDSVGKRCNAPDGLADGIIGANPQACTFDPAVLQCTGAKDHACLSPAQVTALKKDFGGLKNSAGQSLYASWPWDGGIKGADWRNWRLRTSTTPAPDARDYSLFATDAMLTEFVTPRDPAFNVFTFNLDIDPARVNAYAAIYNTTSTDVAAFRNRGGKMLIVYGTSDPIFSANDSIDYYERLGASNGGAESTKDFARLYLVHGMNYCSASGGPSTDAYDALTPLADWVENVLLRIASSPKLVQPRPGLDARGRCARPTDRAVRRCR